MPNPFGLPEAQPKLAHYKYAATSGSGGVATFTWSDGTVTERQVSSQAEGWQLFQEIQQNGGVKPD